MAAPTDPVTQADLHPQTAVGGLDPNAAVKFATDTSGLYPNLCDHFVGLAYGKAHSGYPSAKDHWAQTPAKLRHPGDTNAPVGALVFFNGAGQYGHVAIVTGKTAKGEPIITTTHTQGGRPVEMPLSQAKGLGYSGWATPYFQGKTAKLSGANLSNAVSTVASDPAAAAATASAQAGAAPAGQDKLSLKDAASMHGFDLQFVKDHPDVAKVFQDAVDQGWFTSGAVGQQKFDAAFQQTGWYRNNSTFAQQYIFNHAKNAGKGDENVAEQDRVAEQFVKDAATRLGAKLSDQDVKRFAKYTLMNGWNADPGRAKFLDQALTGQLSYKDNSGRQWQFQTNYLDYKSGDTAKTIQALRDSAYKNGLTYSEDWFQSAAKSVAIGASSVDDYLREIRTLAASQYPVFHDKIVAGSDAMDLASPYINKMASTLEIDANRIGLNDPTIKKALGGVDAKGNPTATGLWDFEKSLYSDPRYRTTKGANERVDSLISKIGQMFGFAGGGF